MNVIAIHLTPVNAVEHCEIINALDCLRPGDRETIKHGPWARNSTAEVALGRFRGLRLIVIKYLTKAKCLVSALRK